MKFVTFVAVALALAAVISAQEQDKELKPYKRSCVFSIEADVKSLLRHNTYKLLVNGNYIRFYVKNHDGTIISDYIFRPDITETDNTTGLVYFRMFRYSEGECYDSAYPLYYLDMDPMFMVKQLTLFDDDYLQVSYLIEGGNFTNMDKSVPIHEDDKEKYTCYYDNSTYVSKDDFALYVDNDGKIVAMVAHNNLPGERVEATFTYSDRAFLDDFTFEKKYIYNCSHNEVMEAPPPNATRCAASVAQAAVALVAATLLSAFLALF